GSERRLDKEEERRVDMIFAGEYISAAGRLPTLPIVPYYEQLDRRPAPFFQVEGSSSLEYRALICSSGRWCGLAMVQLHAQHLAIGFSFHDRPHRRPEEQIRALYSSELLPST
ncbi:hypothetical protein Trydic_g12303, partial [Trypoxylus dichotomus]